MAAFYANEQFPRRVGELLRCFGHDVLTVQEAGNRGLSDEAVLAFSKAEHRAALALNRKDFIKLHRADSNHSGIIVCSRDDDWQRQPAHIHNAVGEFQDLSG